MHAMAPSARPTEVNKTPSPNATFGGLGTINQNDAADSNLDIKVSSQEADEKTTITNMVTNSILEHASYYDAIHTNKFFGSYRHAEGQDDPIRRETPFQ